MIALRDFTKRDAAWICERIYPNLSISEATEMIGQWNKKLVQGHYFEMLAVWCDEEPCGTVSLYEQDGLHISLGVEIIPEFRKLGIATVACQLAEDRAKELGYRGLVSQVRQDNEASIALHRRLGFELTAETVNRKGNLVFLYKKDL